MRSILSKCAAVVVITCSALLAQSYRGVQVGQRSDFLPPDFDQVERGEYDAQFNTEQIRVFVQGALVTGFVVAPEIPVTLAEAIAKYGDVADTSRMLVLLDRNGDPQGLVDPIRRISYITRAFGPDGIVSSIGFYDQNTALLIWTDYAQPKLLQSLETAAKNASLQNLDSRPHIATLEAKARYMLQEVLKSANEKLQELTELLNRYHASCTDSVSSECQQAKQTQGPALIRVAEQFRFSVKEANGVYSTNAELFGASMPPDLARLDEVADRLLPQIPFIPQAQWGVLPPAP